MRLTDLQYRRLRMLGNGGMLVSGGNKRDWKTLHDRGLVVGDLGGQGAFINGVEITAAGLRAMADHMDRTGLATPSQREKTEVPGR